VAASLLVVNVQPWAAERVSRYSRARLCCASGGRIGKASGPVGPAVTMGA